MSQFNPEVGRSTSSVDTDSNIDRTFGDECRPKEKGIVRFLFQNINGLGYSHNSIKSESINNLLQRHEVDAMILAETNVNWGKVRRHQTLPQRCRRWLETSKVVVSYNQHQKKVKAKHQPGGTAVISTGEIALRISGSQYDDKRMGRWASQTIQGKKGITTRIVSVYVPILTSKYGHKKVACQQQRVLLSMGIKDNVMTVFWRDFWQQIDKWLAAGEQLVVGGDWNKDITSPAFLAEFESRNMIPAVASRHGRNLPATHNNGSLPIDEIFCSDTLQLVASGYLEHGSSLSDHRPIWVDINKTSMIGSKSTLKPTFEARKLKTNDPRVVNKYIKILREQLDNDNVLQRAATLNKSISDNILSTQQRIEYEELDKLRTKAMKVAENQCRKLKMGAVKWSPKLQNARNKIEYYTLSRRKKLGRKVSSKILLRLSKRTGCNAVALSVQELGKAIKEAYKQYKKVKKESWKVREEFLSQLAEALERAGKGQKASIIKRLIATESQRSLFRKLAYIHQKNRDLSTKFITISTPEGQVQITEKEEMERAIIAENKDKYHQTESSCPFMKFPLNKHFGEMGKGIKTDKVLEGTYQPSQVLSPQTRDYIELCRFPKEELIINPLTRSLDYFTKSWKRMKERTSSRDIHFGHYKAAIEDDSLMQLHYNLAEIPFRTGYAPSRWKSATNVMILKKEGDTNVDKLRTLVLFESDFNHNNKFLGRTMMHHMVDTGKSAKEQYSVPGKKCIDHVLNRKLFFDLVRYQKTSAAMSGVDLKSCYDRVSHAPAYLAMRSYGIPSEPIESMFQCIQDMKYYTFTAHGMSKESFGGKEDNYIAKPNGLGQGNGAGPSVWSVVSTKMFEVMHKRGATTSITSPLSSNKMEICGFAFVDDTDLITSSIGKNDSLEEKTKMQHTVNEWEAVSRTTGGALAPHKCWSWIIAFDWKNDTWSYKSTNNEDHKMTVKDSTGKVVQMVTLEAHMAKEMLGVQLAPDGNQEAQLKTATEKMRKFSEYIRTGHVNKHEAWVSLNMVAMKSLEYILPAMSLSETEYSKLMTPVLQQFLPKMGVNRNIKHDLLYSPATVQGLGVKNPYILQGVDHIRDITEHIWKETMTGDLLKCNLEQLRIEIGDNISILNSNYNKYKPLILTDSYAQNTWEFMSKHNITLDVEIDSIPLLRDGDSCIMRGFIDNPNIPRSSLAQLNRCRIYLKVFTVSDISSGDGTRIRDEVWHGRQFQTGRNICMWPIWGRPSLSSWSYWRTALKATFCTEKDKVLKLPLHQWINVPQYWEWFCIQRDEHSHLIQYTKQGYLEYKKIGRSQLHKRYSSQKVRQYKVKEGDILLPTTVTKAHRSFIMSSPWKVRNKNDVEETQARTRWLNVDKYSKGPMSKIQQAILNGTLIAVSDGSYNENKGLGTASWILSTQDRTAFITAGAISPGNPEIQTSYRSEILGILGILEEVDAMCTQFQLTDGTCTIFCDGLSALQVIQEASIQSVNTRQASCDLISACVKLKNKIPITLKYAHVKGHQDDRQQLCNLSVPAQLNVLMDGLAKDLLEDNRDINPQTLSGHYLGFTLPRHTGTIFQKFKESLYDSIMTKKCHSYWISKDRYRVEDINNINWTAQANAMSGTNKTSQRTIAKWCSGWIATGKNMQRWNMRYSGNCVFCQHPNEDTTHILKCTNTLAINNWKKQLAVFDNTLIKLKTAYPLRKAIILELRAWRNNDKTPSHQYADEILKKSICDQRALGWKVFLEGLLTTSIITYQHNHLKQHFPQQRVTTWSKRVVKAGWKVIMEIWKYRNDILHTTDNIELMQGRQILEETVAKEWNIGLHNLPILEFSHLFRLKLDELMKKSTQSKKDWLLTVKSGRFLHNDNGSPEDEFDTNPALRDWIGLPKLKQEKPTVKKKHNTKTYTKRRKRTK